MPQKGPSRHKREKVTESGKADLISDASENNLDQKEKKKKI